MVRTCAGAVCLALLASGCAKSKPESRLEDAISRVEQNLGQRPDWTVPWDEAAPIWDGESVLTLDESLVLALRNNRQLRADLETIGQASADLLQASLYTNPMLNFMIMFPSGGGRAMLWANGLPQIPLQDLWLIPARKKVAKAVLQSAILRVADQAVETAAEVKRIYAGLQYNQKAMVLFGENLEIIRQSTQIIRGRQMAGQATQVEVNLSEIRHMRMRSDLTVVESDYRAGKRQLLMLMGVASASADWRVTPLGEIPEAWVVETDEEQLLFTAAEQRLDLKAAEWMVQAAESDIGLNRRAGLPDMAVGVGFQRAGAPPGSGQSLAGRAGNTAVRGLVGRATGMPAGPMPQEPFQPRMREMKWMVGPMFDMELPIFDWNQAGVARALAVYNQRVAEYENQLQQTVLQVRENLVRLRQAHQQAIFYEQSIMPAVEQNLEVARRSYIAGQEDLTVYLDVQEDLLRTRLQQVGFVRDYLVSLADLERAMGGRVTLPEAGSLLPELAE
jgi:outer membrane protein, heavy metal efflux system